MIEKQFETLIKKRNNWLKADLENGFNTFQIIANLYSEPTHFVYEILQNAEDAEAATVSFCLHSDRLEIFHNGREFTLRDIDSITAIAKSTKSDNVNAVGKFGIGFKSVYAIAETPLIVTKSYTFQIDKFILPIPAILDVQLDEYLGEYTTKIILPFKNTKHSQQETYEMLSEKLKKLEPETLLFLKNIQCIKVSDHTLENDDLINKAKLYHKEKKKCRGSQEIRITNGKKHQNYADQERVTIYAGDSIENWMIFRDVIKDSSGAEYCIEIAYKIDMDLKGNEYIQYVKSAKIAVMFMTEKITNLGYIIQGPYKTTPARDNVPPEDSWNQFVMQKVGELTVKSMIRMRDTGKLDRGFLTVMPVNSDYFAGKTIKEAIALPIFEKVKEAFISDSFIPTQDPQNPYINPRQAVLPNTAKLSRLVSNDQLYELVQKTVFWVDSEITENKTQTHDLFVYFRDQLKIEIYTDEKFAKNFETDRFVKKQTDEWIIQFYSYLADNASSYFKKPYQKYYYQTQKIQPGAFFNARIAKLSDNSFHRFFKDDIDSTPQVFLPGEFENVNNTIKRIFVKNQDAMKLFTTIGLKEFVLFNEIMQNVLPKYLARNSNITCPVDYSDHKKIAKLLSSGTTKQVAELLDKLKTVKIFCGNLLWDGTPVMASTFLYGIVVKNSSLIRADGDRLDTIKNLTNTKVVVLDSLYCDIYTLEQFKQMGFMYKPSDAEITLKIILPNYISNKDSGTDTNAISKNINDIVFMINSISYLHYTVVDLEMVKSSRLIRTSNSRNKIQWSSLNETYARTATLIEYFKGNSTIQFLSEKYKEYDSEAYFAIEKACYKYPKIIVKEFSSITKYQKGFTTDCIIEGLKECLDRSVSKSISIFIWNYLVSNVDKLLFSGVIERANDRYYKGNGHSTETIDSDFFCSVKQAKWLFNKEDKRYRPSEISVDNFCEEYDSRSAKAKQLITQLNIQKTSARSEAISHLSSIEKRAIEMLSLYGEGALAELEVLLKKKKEAENKAFEKKDFVNAYVQAVSQEQTISPKQVVSLEKEQKIAMKEPEIIEWSNGSDNSQAEFIRDKAEENLEKMGDIQEKTVERKITDRSSLESEEVRNFLNTEYDGQCQLCSIKLPTQKGNNYFNTYRFIKRNEGKAYSNHLSNVLCLCPNCYVKVEQGPQPNDLQNILSYAGKLLKNDLLEQEVPEYKKDMYVVPILLSGVKRYLHFSKRHFNNIAAVFKVLATELNNTEN